MRLNICAKRRFAWSERPDDLLMPSPPRAAYFDGARDEWVLSGYADVLAALNDSRLVPAGQVQPSIHDGTHKFLSAAQLSEWRSEIESLAHSRVAALPVDRPVDLVGEL